MKAGIYDILHILTDFQLVILIILLIHKGREKISSWFLALFFLGQLVVSVEGLWWHHYHYSLSQVPFLAYIGRPFIFIWGPSIYLFILSEINASFRFRRIHLLHYLPSILLVVYFTASFYLYPAETQRQIITSGAIYTHTTYLIFVVGMMLQVLLYTLLAMIRLKKSGTKGSTLADQKRMQWNTFILHGYFITCIVYYLSFLLEGMIDNRTISEFLPFLFFSFYFTAILYRAMMNSYFNTALHQGKSRVLFLSRQEAGMLLHQLDNYMEKEKPYLTFDLTLAKLATSLGVKERHLSQVINEFRKQNFHDFINQYRVETAKRLLEQCVNTKKTVLEVIYESGFNSKTAFNVAFKKQTGLTPTQFKNSIKTHSQGFAA